MTEQLLQYIWQFCLFNSRSMETTGGEKITLIHPGSLNKNQGPDFLHGEVKIGDTLWSGHIELHLKSSDWYRHGHTNDEQYRNVIFHVVWEADEPSPDIPTLELRGRVSGRLLDQYRQFMLSPKFIACAMQLHHVPPLVISSWMERQLIERMYLKVEEIYPRLQKNNFHWEETLWHMLAKNVGMQVNADAFETIALSLPLNILIRHRTQILHLEALLLGQAGMLEGRFTEDYPKLLQKEYQFLKKKYGLKQPPLQIKLLRMRPAHFPAVRLTQLAMLLASTTQLFSSLLKCEDIKQLRQIFDVTANDYWHYHYRLDELTVYQPKRLGTQMMNNIIINTVAPLLFTYGYHYNDEKIISRSIDWLNQLPPEKNNLLNGWRDLNVIPSNAAQSQALIRLSKTYCNQKRCLECAIGNAILKRRT